MAGGGGSWKVAYADFVTAMMALFLVLWLVSQDDKIKESVERTFQHPFASLTKESAGIFPNKEAVPLRSETGNFDSAAAIELNALRRLAQDLAKQLKDQNEGEEPIKLEMTPEGLRISIFDRSQKPLFDGDSDSFTDYGKWIFSTLAWDLARYSTFNIELEGHTEKKEDAPGSSDPWRISANRANAGRLALTEHGVKGEQIKKVAGFADTAPLTGLAPENLSNRRVTVMLKIKGA